MSFAIDRLLETIVKQHATEAWVVEGKPPFFRIDGSLRKALIPPLVRSDLEVLLNLEPLWKDNCSANGVADGEITYNDNYTPFGISFMNVGDVLWRSSALSKTRMSSRWQVAGDRG
jgi:hypothetical protein